MAVVVVLLSVGAMARRCLAAREEEEVVVAVAVAVAVAWLTRLLGSISTL